MALDVIIKLAELGADLPVNIVIKEDDKYYDIDYIAFDEDIHEFIIVAQDDSAAQYSTRGDVCEYTEYSD